MIDAKTNRKDIAKGSMGTISGIATNKPVLAFEAQHNGAAMSADVAVNLNNLEICSDSGGGDAAKPVAIAKATKVKGCDFLQNDGTSTYEVVEKWEKLSGSGKHCGSCSTKWALQCTRLHNQCQLSPRKT